MKRFLLFVCIACATIVLTGCEKSYSSGVVTIYGNVVDAKTGTPLPIAQIQISELSAFGVTSVSTVTGSDGTYEVDVTLPKGEIDSYKMEVNVSKSGYYDTSTYFTLSRDMVGKRVQQSLTLRPY